MILPKKELGELLSTMTKKEILFVRYLAISSHKRNSAIKAGYAEKNAASTASTLLRKPNILQFLSHLEAKAADKLNLKLENVVKELAKVAFSSPLDYLVDTDEGLFELKDLEFIENPEAIAKMKFKQVKDPKSGKQICIITEVQNHDKMKALELLGKHLAMFTDNIDLKGDGSSTTPDEQTVMNVYINHRKKGEPLDE